MELVTKALKKNIADILPEKCSIAFDGWTENSTHFIGVFAFYSADIFLNHESVLLDFSPIIVETSFTAKNHCDFLE